MHVHRHGHAVRTLTCTLTCILTCMACAMQVGGHRLLQLRNPHASHEFTGEWSDGSALWAAHPQVRAAAEADEPKARPPARMLRTPDRMSSSALMGSCAAGSPRAQLRRRVAGFQRRRLPQPLECRRAPAAGRAHAQARQAHVGSLW